MGGPEANEMSMSTEEFTRRYGPWALIAGASEGIGQSYTDQLAARGMNVVLVARRQGLLDEAAEKIRSAHGVEVRAISADLGDADIVETLGAQVRDLEIGLFIYNAAYSPLDEFVNTELDQKMAMLDVNVRAPVALSSHFAPLMVERGRGGIIIMSSMAGFQGSSQIATYAATKAFDTIFAEGLWAELKPRGVDVLACVTGATLTPNFMDNTPKEKWSGVFPLEPSQVAAEGLANLDRGPIHIAGAMNRGVHALFSHLPRRAVVGLMTRIANGLYGDKG